VRFHVKLLVFSRSGPCRGENVFVKNVLLTWEVTSSTCDYHIQTNSENYEKVASGKLTPTLQPNSVVIVNF
jgi:hypothetical protein